MGTFDGHDEINLPKIYQDFVITISTDTTKEGEGKLTIRTSPNWHMFLPTKTQWVVMIPMTPQSGKLPVVRWISFGDQNVPYTIEPSEFTKLTKYSRRKLKEFTGRIMKDQNYLIKVAKDIQKHKLKKKRECAYSRRSSQMRNLQQGMRSMQLTDFTNIGFDHVSMQRSPPGRMLVTSVHSEASMRVVL
ncbi:hypothetical protein EDD18DRAFT_1459600 [Armillaria luteobubalina]|uniref:Uncharacterized protein n=1 Tax=Armillaria luteobubalina TaxID=153913 RepID=A0AA39QER7_9AGAR|nr:hypothetical protein EDD18DRAFT_1459600 [Armillaria luteobubalina]